MYNEVNSNVFEVIERIRLSAPKLGITEVIEKLGVRDVKYTDAKYEYAWRLPAGGHVITIWTEDVRVHPVTGRWFYVDTLDTVHRRGGGERAPKQQARAVNRLETLQELHQAKGDTIAVLQINQLSIQELEQNENARISIRVKDDERWHVARWDEERQRAVLVRGSRGWVPTVEDIDGAPATSEGDGEEEEAQDAASGAREVVFPDQAHRDLVEAAAVEEVTGYFRRHGFKVNDVSTQNRGYDLEVVDQAGGAVLHVEVKGTSIGAPSFFLTRNEFKCSQTLGTWRLAIVTSALSQPALRVLTAQEMDDEFGFEPLVWRCTPRLERV